MDKGNLLGQIPSPPPSEVLPVLVSTKNVRIERTDEQGRPTILTTEQLTYVPETEYAHTKLAVKIEAANGITTGVGMQTYLNESKMRLLSNVRGRHEVR